MSSAPRPRRVRIEQRLARRGGVVELLRAPAALFAVAARARAACYDAGWLVPEELDAAVVSVGNLSAGGTGKTPMAIWVAERLAARGRRVGLLSRGYGSRPGVPNDEARVIARRLPDVPHEQARERAEGGRRLVASGVDVVVLDDGFQHRRLARDLDLVLLDATRPFGLGPPPGGGAPVRALLPRGLLREPPRALARAHAVVLTRVDQAETGALEALEREARSLAPGAVFARARHVPVRLVSSASEPARAPESLRGASVDLVSGIAHPEAFERTVEGLGARVVSHRVFPDHHDYGPADLRGLGAREVVTTAKDAVKLDGLGVATWTLEVELAVVHGEEALERLLAGLPEARAQRERAGLHEGLHG